MTEPRLWCRCPDCGRVVATFTPKGGDGSVVRPLRHNTPQGGLCGGRYSEVQIENTFDTRAEAEDSR